MAESRSRRSSSGGKHSPPWLRHHQQPQHHQRQHRHHQPQGQHQQLSEQQQQQHQEQERPEHQKEARREFFTGSHGQVRFQVHGYGSHLLRRLLLERFDGEEVGSDEPMHALAADLLWNGNAASRRLLRWPLDERQLVNHFPGSSAMGSKRALLHNLRHLCAVENVSITKFFPRAYDLRQSHEVQLFLMDFAVTKAEAVLRQTPNLTNEALSTSASTAISLLERLLVLWQEEFRSLQRPGTESSSRTRPSECVLGTFLNEDLEVLAPPAPANVSATRPSSKERAARAQDSEFIGAMYLEAAWWQKELSEIAERQFSINGHRSFWILKDPSANCGRGIRVCADLSTILKHAIAKNWDIIAQKYLERPLLVGPEKRKCDIRIWVLVTSWNPIVIWAWPQPYLRLASKAFNWEAVNIDDPFVHLTNRTVQIKGHASKVSGSPDPCTRRASSERNGSGSSNTSSTSNSNSSNSNVHNISCNPPEKCPYAPPPPREEDEEHIWMLDRFFEEVEGQFPSPSEEPGLPPSLTTEERWKEHTWPRMLEAIRHCVKCSRNEVGSHSPGCFEFFGFDFLLDADLTPWLLEANSCPDLCEDAGPSLRALVERALTESLGLVFGLKTGEVQLPQLAPSKKSKPQTPMVKVGAQTMTPTTTATSAASMTAEKSLGETSSCPFSFGPTGSASTSTTTMTTSASTTFGESGGRRGASMMSASTTMSTTASSSSTEANAMLGSVPIEEEERTGSGSANGNGELMGGSDSSKSKSRDDQANNNNNSHSNSCGNSKKTNSQVEECDLTVAGAGSWRLCLLEARGKDAREAQLRKVLRPSYLGYSSTFHRSYLDRVDLANMQVVRRALGSHCSSLGLSSAAPGPSPSKSALRAAVPKREVLCRAFDGPFHCSQPKDSPIVVKPSSAQTFGRPGPSPCPAQEPTKRKVRICGASGSASVGPLRGRAFQQSGLN